MTLEQLAFIFLAHVFSDLPNQGGIRASYFYTLRAHDLVVVRSMVMSARTSFMTYYESPSIDLDSAYANRIARMVYDAQNPHVNSPSLPVRPQVPASLRSTAGIPALLGLELAQEKSRLDTDEQYSSFRQKMNQLLGKKLPTLQDTLMRHHEKITASTGQIVDYLSYSEQDICEAAKRLALLDLDVQHKISLAEKLLGSVIPGKTILSQFHRVNDPRFWRRALRVRIMRAREQVFLRMKLVGHRKEKYASDATTKMRLEQLSRQKLWMESTVMIPRFYTQQMADAGTKFEPIALAGFAKGATEHFAKLYTFVNAIDALAVENGLSSGMLTVTLPPTFHPNPSCGKGSWNDDSPRVAHKFFCKQWQSIARDLHRVGIRLSGLRVVEPHQDGCPHYHIWMLYRPENETEILSIVMKYFPAKLKLRAPHKKGEDNSHLDIMYENRSAFMSSDSRPLTHKKEGAQVELSRIDPTISSGASYAMKYLLKTANVGDELVSQIGTNTKDDAKEKKKREKHRETLKRVDAFRSVWGIHQGQLFGIAKCLGVWDELRRLGTKPQNPKLAELWKMARGSDNEGRIEVGAKQRGDAKGFIKALGGLDACQDRANPLSKRFILGRLVEEGKNRYGETIQKTKGIVLLLKERIKIAARKFNSQMEEISSVLVWRTRTTTIESVRTRLTEWTLVAKNSATNAMARSEQVFWNGVERQAGTANPDGNNQKQGLDAVLT